MRVRVNFYGSNYLPWIVQAEQNILDFFQECDNELDEETPGVFEKIVVEFSLKL
jgi:hypothetical protein